MQCLGRISLCVLILALWSGCGTTEQPVQTTSADASSTDVEQQAAGSPSAQAALSPPAAAVNEFLEAVRTGNDEKAAAMLTDLARKKTAEQNIQVAPRGSDTAKFEVGAVENLAENGARVAATWTDLDQTGQPQTNQMLWMLRKEPIGWRIAGIAAEVFPGEPPLLLDFEKPEETLQKLEMLREEVRRRADAEVSKTQQAEKAADSVRR